MADSVLINNATITAVDTVAILYTSPSGGAGTIITAFTATNNSAASVSYKGYIVDVTGTVLGAIIPQKIVVKDKFDSAPSIVNQTVPAGGTIRAENSTADGIDYYSTGREQ